MVRLRRVSPSEPGWTRRRAGRGFVYLDSAGERLPDDVVERVRGLVIPPAWRDVWICPRPNGHLQATGVDDAGRTQYLYHPDWRAQQDAAKFARVTRASTGLPRLRRRVDEDLGLSGMPFERAAATAVRLLDLGSFRIGSDVYLDENGSFGLTTLERRHVRRTGQRLRFCFVGKSGVEHECVVADAGVVGALEDMRRRRGDPQLLGYKTSGRWRALGAEDVNDYIRDIMRDEFTAKDFRTWHATVLAAVGLAGTDEGGRSAASRKRAVRAVLADVADYLGNTPTVARSSYVDPRVIDAYEAGETIPRRTAVAHAADPVGQQGRVERATRRLVSARRP